MRPTFSEDDLVFAAAFTPAVAPTVIASHIPLAPESGFPEATRSQLLALFAGGRLALVAGHWHRQEIRSLAEEGVELFWAVGAVSGSFWSGPPDAQRIPVSWMSDGTPRGYGVLEWAAQRFQPSYRPFGSASLLPLHAFLPKVSEQGSVPIALLSVNLYLGHAGSHIRFRIAGGPWQMMEGVIAIDPMLLPSLVEQDGSERFPAWRRLPEPRPRSHLRRADLAAGEQRVEIEADDGFGGIDRLETSDHLKRRIAP